MVGRFKNGIFFIIIILRGALISLYPYSTRSLIEWNVDLKRIQVHDRDARVLGIITTDDRTILFARRTDINDTEHILEHER